MKEKKKQVEKMRKRIRSEWNEEKQKFLVEKKFIYMCNIPCSCSKVYGYLAVAAPSYDEAGEQLGAWVLWLWLFA